jgi:predicted Zn finger-like uncharacterized protein
MLVTCPSCGGAFEVSEESLGVKVTVACPLCARIVVVRDAHAVPPGKREATVPFDPGTEADLAEAEPEGEPRPDESTDVARGGGLRLPVGKRVALAILSGPCQGEVRPLERPRVRIGLAGAAAGAEIEIDDPELSGLHATLELQGDRIRLRDLGSRRGTFIGDERVENRELLEGAEFRLGETRMMVIVSDPD